MRLIDADKLIKDRVENDPVVIAAKHTPTAYDVDKIVEKLKKEIRDTDMCQNCDKDINCDECRAETAVKIVNLVVYEP